MEATFPLVHSQIPAIHTLEQADLLSASLVDSIFGSHLNLFGTTFDYLPSPHPHPDLPLSLCMIWDFGDGLASTGDLTIEGHFPLHI